MDDNKQTSGSGALPGNRLWDFFASVRLSVVLLLSLAATSIIGTVIPQNADQSSYINKFGPKLYSVLDSMSVFNMYQSWWFRLLLCLLVINLVVCSVRRLKATWKVIFPEKIKYNPDRFRKAASRVSIDAGNLPPETAKDICEKFLGRRYRKIQTRQEDFSSWIFGEKRRWTRLGVYVVHFSVILLVSGGLIGSLFGFEGMMNVPEEETRQTFFLRNSEKSMDLDFAIRCDEFSVSHYPSGRPKEYRSDIAIIENGQVVRQHRLRVNDPLRYKGINIFQSSYGQTAASAFTIVFTEAESGMRFEKKASMGQAVDMPAGRGKLVIEDFSGNFSFRGHNIGPAFLGRLEQPSGQTRPVLLPANFPRFDRMRGGDYAISVEDVEYAYYTGLQITRDPGVPLVYTGFALMILGCYVTFFMHHQKTGIEILAKDNKTEIFISRISARKKPGLKNDVRRLAGKLEKKITQSTGA
jgi:cytochrome c biogenesis protein